jgi:hypothetical protein
MTPTNNSSTKAPRNPTDGYTVRASAAALIAIDAHTRTMNLDDENDPLGIGAWHLLVSLRILCARSGHDPKTLFESAMEEDLDGAQTPLPEPIDPRTAHAPAADPVIAALRDLVEWEHATGGWEAPCWARAKTALKCAGLNHE